MNTLPKIVCVVGPTATGKSDLAADLALRLGGEVVSADSMQLYRGMDIGTAKPTAGEMRGVPHHMLDVAQPGEDYSVARYAHEAGRVVDDILARGRLPIVAGGTGLYIGALLGGMTFAERTQDEQYRENLYALAEERGAPALFSLLEQADPESAARLHPNDIKRVVRALEVLHVTGATISAHNRATAGREPRYAAVKLGLTFSDRQALYARIDRRVDSMLACGLVEEVSALLKIPGVRESTAMQAIGYKELANARRRTLFAFRRRTGRQAKLTPVCKKTADMVLPRQGNQLDRPERRAGRTGCAQTGAGDFVRARSFIKLSWKKDGLLNGENALHKKICFGRICQKTLLFTI